jgi:hypothetical protein
VQPACRAPDTRARAYRLTHPELLTLAGALGPGLFSARFAGLLRRALLEGLADGSPDLVRKLHSLSDRQFEELCRELRRLTRGDG